MGYLIELDTPGPRLRPVRGSRLEPVRAPRDRVRSAPAREAPRGIDWDTRRTEVIAWHNPRFRRLLRQPGNAGRDRLWAFMRHWLSALILKHRPDLHRRLPSSYNVGHPLS